MPRRPALLAARLFGALTLLAVAGCSTIRMGDGPRGTPRPAALPLAARVVWIDTQALFDSLGTSERLRAGLERLARTGFTDVVVEVKPYGGDVAYPSRIATRLVASGGHTPDPAWDVAADAVRTGRALGMRVHLAANVFAEGDHARRTGAVYSTRSTWQTTVVGPDGTPRVSTRLRPDERASDVAYTNPVRPDVRNAALAVLSELAGRYQPDGVLLDRMRFESAVADVSPESREAFERWRRLPVEHWPADVAVRTGPGPGFTPGPLYPEWLEWRAGTLRTFVEVARQAVRGANPTTRLGLVVPADYAAAAEVGLNWGAVSYDPKADYPWATTMYREKSLAAFVDVLVPEMPVGVARADTALLRTVERRVARTTRVVPLVQVRAFPTAEAFEEAVRVTVATSGSLVVSTYSDLARRPTFWAALGRIFPAPPAPTAAR